MGFGFAAYGLVGLITGSRFVVSGLGFVKVRQIASSRVKLRCIVGLEVPLCGFVAKKTSARAQESGEWAAIRSVMIALLWLVVQGARICHEGAASATPSLSNGHLAREQAASGGCSPLPSRV